MLFESRGLPFEANFGDCRLKSYQEISAARTTAARRFRSFRPSAALAALAVMALAAPVESLAHARENLTIATPFEVGASPSGNYLAAIVAGASRDTLRLRPFSARRCATIRAIRISSTALSCPRSPTAICGGLLVRPIASSRMIATTDSRISSSASRRSRQHKFDKARAELALGSAAITSMTSHRRC